MLETGMTVPNFTIPTDTGSFSVADNAGRNVVVFFYPRADTSACTKESVAFSALNTHRHFQGHCRETGKIPRQARAHCRARGR